MIPSIRIATADDAKFVHDVYGYYVEHTDVTFSTENPSVEAYAHKIEKTLALYPFLILDVDGKPCGFAYAGQIRPHEAYQWTAEGTIYLAPNAPKRQGLGRMLYQMLLDTLEAMNMQTVFGVITATNEASIQMHFAMGFEKVGHFSRMGNKRGKWLDVVWMQKTLHTLPDAAMQPIPFAEYRLNGE